MTDIAQEARDASEAILEIEEAEAEALEIDDESADDETAKEAAAEVESASGGQITQKTYLASTRRSTSDLGQGTFAKTVNDARRQLMVEAGRNINTFTARALTTASRTFARVEELCTAMGEEALAIASAGPLLSPPAHADVGELRDNVATVVTQTENSITELRSARARRDAAARLKGEAVDNASLPSRYLEPLPTITRVNEPTTVDRELTTAAAGAGLDAQAQLRGQVDERLSTATAALKNATLSRVSYLALCSAMTSINNNATNLQNAQRGIKKAKKIINNVVASLDDGFLRELRSQMHEASVEILEALAARAREKVANLDAWLALQPPRLPTVIHTVDAVGDTVADHQITDSLANYCDLNKRAFCDGQGLWELAASVDAETAQGVAPRGEAMGRVPLVIDAPVEITGYRRIEPLPDQETSMILVSLSPTTLVARLQRAAAGTDLKTAVPVLTGLVVDDVDAGSPTIVISGLGANIASLGTVTVGAQVLRFSAHIPEGLDVAFTLIDLPTTDIASGATALVTGEHRDLFTTVYAPSPNIHGGPGKLLINGDGEYEERLEYTSSTFDETTGHYTFTLASAPEHDHQRAITCKPHDAAKRLLFKPADILIPASRFNVVGGEVVGGGFDFRTSIPDAAPYDVAGTLYLVIDDVNYTLDAAACVLFGAGSKLVLRSPPENKTAVTLSSISRPLASTKIRARLDARQKYDLGVSALGSGSTQTASGRLNLGMGRAIERRTVAITAVSRSGLNQLLTTTEILTGDEVGMNVILQSLITSFTATISAVSTHQLTVPCHQLTGTVSVDREDPPSTKIFAIGVGTKFKTELKKGDKIFLDCSPDPIDTTVVMIWDDEKMEIAEGLDSTAGNAYLLALANRTAMIEQLRQENKEFASIKNVDDEIYEFTTTTPLTFAHDEQDARETTSVQVLNDSIDAFLTQFDDNTPKPRFDTTITPPTATEIRAHLLVPASAALVDGYVMAATKIFVGGREYAVDDVEAGYVFHLPAPTGTAIAAGEEAYVESGDVFEALHEIFGESSWSASIDEILTDIGADLKLLASKLCRLLSGRPLSLASTATAVANAAALATSLISPLRMFVDVLVRGLPTSEVIDKFASKFETMGIDKGAEAIDEGDVLAVSQLSASSATSEGQAAEKTKEYRENLVGYGDVMIADAIVSEVEARKLGKEIFANHQREYKEIAAEHIAKRREAAQKLVDDAEKIT